MDVIMSKANYACLPLAERMAWNTIEVACHCIGKAFGHDSQLAVDARALRWSVFEELSNVDKEIARIAKRGSIRRAAAAPLRKQVWERLTGRAK